MHETWKTNLLSFGRNKRTEDGISKVGSCQDNIKINKEFLKRIYVLIHVNKGAHAEHNQIYHDTV